jgi:hypothetical protein
MYGINSPNGSFGYPSLSKDETKPIYMDIEKSKENKNIVHHGEEENLKKSDIVPNSGEHIIGEEFMSTPEDSRECAWFVVNVKSPRIPYTDYTRCIEPPENPDSVFSWLEDLEKNAASLDNFSVSHLKESLEGVIIEIKKAWKFVKDGKICAQLDLTIKALNNAQKFHKESGIKHPLTDAPEGVTGRWTKESVTRMNNYLIEKKKNGNIFFTAVEPVFNFGQITSKISGDDITTLNLGVVAGKIKHAAFLFPSNSFRKFISAIPNVEALTIKANVGNTGLSSIKKEAENFFKNVMAKNGVTTVDQKTLESFKKTCPTAYLNFLGKLKEFAPLSNLKNLNRIIVEDDETKEFFTSITSLGFLGDGLKSCKVVTEKEDNIEKNNKIREFQNGDINPYQNDFN